MICASGERALTWRRIFGVHITFTSITSMDSTTFDRKISYLPEFHVLLCLLCCIGVRRSQLITHFRNQHRFTSVQSKALDAFCESIIPISDVRSIETVPSYVENPVGGLPIHSDAVRCQLDRTECQYVCRSTEKMRKHCRKVHQWQQQSHRGRPSTATQASLPPLPWISVQCQRLFASGPGSHYFEVRTTGRTTVETPTTGTWQQMESAVQQAQEALLNDIQDDPDDTSPWLRRTRWAEILQGFTRTQLLRYIQEPDANQEPDETQLWDAVRSLIEHCQRTVMSSGNFVRMQMVQTEQTARPQQPLQAYLHRADLLTSCRLWQQITLFFVRSHSESSNLPYKLTTIQQRSLQKLEDHLRTESHEEVVSSTQREDQLSTLEQACLDFYFSLLNHSLRTDEYESALIVALAVLGLTQQGFRGPFNYPSMLSGLIKTSRFMMTQVAVRPSEDTKDFFYDLGTEAQPDQNMISHVEQIVREFMVRGSQSPMQWMLDLRSYGMKIAFNTTSTGQMDWIGDQIVYQDLQFTMPEFRAFVHGLSYKAERLLLQELLFTRTISRPVPTIDLIQIKDNVIDHRTGWNFLQDVRNSSLINGAEWMRQRIHDHPTLRAELFPNHIDPVHSPSSVLTYLAHVRTFLTKLFLLIHITGGQPARVPEILTVRHHNSSHNEPRNIFIEDGLVTFVTRYHKGYTISGEQKIIHQYLPHEVSLMVVQYLWLVFPFIERLKSFYCSSYELSAFL